MALRVADRVHVLSRGQSCTRAPRRSSRPTARSPRGILGCEMKRVAVIGVGLLGTAVAERLLGGGFEVRGYDTRPRQLEALRFRGLRPARSVAEAVDGAEAVFTILPSLDAVESVYTGPDGLVDRAPRDAVAPPDEHVSPAARQAARRGVRRRAGFAFLDTPISGTSTHGRARQLHDLRRRRSPPLRALPARVRRDRGEDRARRRRSARPRSPSSPTNLIGRHQRDRARRGARARGQGGPRARARCSPIAARESRPARGMIDMRGPLMVTHASSRTSSSTCS